MRRLKSWLRTWLKLVLVVLAYVWIGAAYKLVYAQSHDLSRFNRKLPISYYQQQFLLDSLLKQTWMFGPDFRDYLGELPSLAALLSSNPQAVLADYCLKRQRELSALPDRYPYSLFCEEALDDAYLYSQGAAYLAIVGAREQPVRALTHTARGTWSTLGLPDFSASTGLARRLADDYPSSPQAPGALIRVAQAEAQDGRHAAARETYRRVLLEYPRTNQAEQAASALYQMALAEGKWQEAVDYRHRAIAAAERVARDRAPARALPPATTVTVLGYRLDLSHVELMVGNPGGARTALELASGELARLRSLTALEEDVEDRVRDRREQLERGRTELWVADLFQKLEVGLPGPPPRPEEHVVRGRILADGRPLPGIDVILGERGYRVPQELRNGPGPIGILAGYRLRGRTDRDGRYEIRGVPGGGYLLGIIYPLRPAGKDGKNAYALALAVDKPPPTVNVEQEDLEIPPIHLRRALDTGTFGEQSAQGDAVRLAWSPWPGAAGYRVEALAAPEMHWQFRRRVPQDQQREFRRNPVLWRQDRVTGTSADCPLAALAPDELRNSQMAQYAYRVTALDAAGKELAASADPLTRFNLSRTARERLAEVAPKRKRAPGARGSRTGGPAADPAGGSAGASGRGTGGTPVGAPGARGETR